MAEIVCRGTCATCRQMAVQVQTEDGTVKTTYHVASKFVKGCAASRQIPDTEFRSFEISATQFVPDGWHPGHPAGQRREI